MALRIISNVNPGHVKFHLRRMLTAGISEPKVRQYALDAITRGSDNVVSIFSWLKSHTQYVKDPAGNELFISPKKMLERIEEHGVAHGDCDDLALLTGSMLGSIGYNVRIALVDGDHDGEIDHALAQVEIGSEWFNIDLSSSAPMGWVIESGNTEYIYPEVT